MDWFHLLPTRTRLDPDNSTFILVPIQSDLLKKPSPKMAFIHSLFKADSNLPIPFSISSHDIQYAILMYPFPPAPKASPGTTAALASLNKMVHKSLNTFLGALPADDLLLHLIGLSTVCEIILPLSFLKTNPLMPALSACCAALLLFKEW